MPTLLEHSMGSNHDCFQVFSPVFSATDDPVTEQENCNIQYNKKNCTLFCNGINMKHCRRLNVFSGGSLAADWMLVLCNRETVFVGFQDLCKTLKKDRFCWFQTEFYIIFVTVLKQYV